MSEPTAFVHLALGGRTTRVGRLWTTAAKGRETATFEYDPEWLRHPERFALEPALALGPGPFHTSLGRALFGALGDSAPDRWGRTLMARAERRRAAVEGRRPRTLRESDYLLGVSDVVRQGALRFSTTPDGPFLAADPRWSVPPLVELPRLLAASGHVEADDETEPDMRLLLAPGSSLGGARPKASVRDRDGHLLVAKFPSRTDDIDVVQWEAVALGLAERARIPVPAWRVEDVAGQHVLLTRRFDRVSAGTGELIRVPFLSATSMLGAADGELHSYLEIADALRQHGAATATDVPALWRRIVFNILVSNTDDHLRNHGFLYGGQEGWRLSPAYDLNPVPTDVKPRVLSTAIGLDEDATASLDLALETASEFAVGAREARVVVHEVGAVVSRWREVAAGLGLSAAACDRMVSAFEHEDLSAALAVRP